MSLFLISTIDTIKDDLRLDLTKELADRGNKIAYITSRPKDANQVVFTDLIKGYQKISPHIDINYFDIKSQFSSLTVAMLFHHSAFHISPEDFVEFTEIAKKRNLSLLCKDFIDKGGLVIGCGVGGVFMTPTLKTAEIIGLPVESLPDTSGFSRVDFEFLPHYSEIDGKQEVITQYAKGTALRIFACHDGDGVKVVMDRIETFGDVVEIEG